MARDLHMNYVRIGSLNVAKALHEFIGQEAVVGTSLSAEAFWSGFAELLRDCGPRNRQLLQVRDKLQSRIDQYHRERSGEPLELEDYERFLRDIGYIVPEGDEFAIRTTDVDDEIAVIAGPQLVVPLSNPRYALNAANARWGSLYDALYARMPSRRTAAPPAQLRTTRYAVSESWRAGAPSSMGPSRSPAAATVTLSPTQ